MWRRDIARIRDVEGNRRPDGEIVLYDVNRGWTRQQALRRHVSATEDLNVMVEQPWRNTG